MTARIAWWTVIGLMGWCGPVVAQTGYGQAAPQPPQHQTWPPYPTLQHRANPQQPSAAPFVLTPDEQARLDQVLAAWEQKGAKVKTFASKFNRWYYNAVFSDQPIVDEGEVQYAAPDKGAFQVFGKQPEHWICDGTSIFQYEFQKKQLTEYKLPPELHGQNITDSPLPFLFGSTAAKLKERYFLRIVTPPDVKGQVWLEARPRFQADAQNFQRAEVILDAVSMLPAAIQTHEPNGKTRTVYKFERPRVNAKDPLRGLDPLNLFNRDPFKPSLPRGWTKVVEEAQTAQTARPATTAVQR